MCTACRINGCTKTYAIHTVTGGHKLVMVIGNPVMKAT